MTDFMSDFEYSMRLFFGDKAYNISGLSLNHKVRNHWLRRTIDKLARQFNGLDAPEALKEALLHAADLLRNVNLRSEQPNWAFVYRLLRIIAHLLGYVLITGRQHYSVMWVQTPAQHYFDKVERGGRWTAYEDAQSAQCVRAKLAAQLRREGISDFQISLIFNTTEYQIKKLKKTYEF